MAYPALRSMNYELANGAIDGKYKRIRPDTCTGGHDGRPGNTYDNRLDLDDVWHGFHESATVRVPGLEKRIPMPYYYPNPPADRNRW